MKAGLAGIVTAVTGLSVRTVNQIVIFGVTLVAAHFLAPADFGVFAIASAAIALIRTLMYTGAFEYLLKAPPGEDAPSECLIINLSLAVLLSGLLVVIAPFSQTVFGTKEVGHLLVVMAPSNLISAFAAWQESQILREKRIRPYYAVTAISEIVAAVGAVGLLMAHFGLIALVGQTYIRSLALFISYFILQPPRFSSKLNGEGLIRIFKWSSARYGSTAVSFVSGYGADFFLGALLSPAATGIYRASSRIVTAVSDVFAHPTQILAATIFSRFAAKRENPEHTWLRIFGASAFLGWSALAGLAAIAEQIVPILLGPQWVGTGSIIALLCAARALSIIDAVTVPLLVAFDKARSVFKIQLVTAVGSVLVLCLIARYGISATALATIAISAVTTLSYCWLSLRSFPGSRTYVRSIIAISVLPALVTFLAAKASMYVMPLNLGPATATTLAVLAGGLGWLAVVAVLRRSAMDALHAFNA